MCGGESFFWQVCVYDLLLVLSTMTETTIIIPTITITIAIPPMPTSMMIIIYKQINHQWAVSRPVTAKQQQPATMIHCYYHIWNWSIEQGWVVVSLWERMVNCYCCNGLHHNADRFPMLPQRIRKGKLKKFNANRQCDWCLTSKTPLWRSGPFNSQ